MNTDSEKLDLFDAVRIVQLPDGANKIPAYYSQSGVTDIHVGDIGVVIGEWPGNRYRVEAVDEAGAILWQDHFTRRQLDVLPPIEAAFCRRRINEHWAWQLALTDELLEPDTRRQALAFARKVMAFARQNVDILVDRLAKSGYEFANRKPVTPPEENVIDNLLKLGECGVHVPVALQAWLIEVGGVDFCGTHPDWPRTGYAGMRDNNSTFTEPWYTAPLVVQVSTQSLLKELSDDTPQENDYYSSCIEIAPDDVTKANISGAGPISISSAAPRFDNILVGQHGSLTLLSYLRLAFTWGGFPGFDFIPDAPTGMLQDLARGLTRL